MLVSCLHILESKNVPCVLAAATSSSTQCGAETSSVVPWQGGSTISVNGDEPVSVSETILCKLKSICRYQHRGAASFLG